MKPDVLEIEYGDLRIEARGPKWLLERIDLDAGFHVTNDDDAARLIVDALGSEYRIADAMHGDCSYIRYGGEGASREVCVFVSRELGRLLDPEDAPRRERISTFAKLENARTYRVCPFGEPATIVPDEGESRQFGSYNGLTPEGKFEVVVEVPAAYEGDSSGLYEYDSLRALVEDGWKID